MKGKRPAFKLPADRQSTLRDQQNLKMARSAQAYVRGNTTQFYAWLRRRGRAAIPAGPPVWICGDCHVGNLGPVADGAGRIDIQIRDLDQTVVGNPAHDLIRLAHSLATAARGSDLPGVTTAVMLEEMMEGYERGLSARAGDRAGQGKRPEAIRVVMKQAVSRTWKHLAKERIEDLRPTIPRGERFWPLARAEKRELKALFRTREVRHLIVALKSRKDDAPVRFLDAAYWMKGCSSLGRLRFAVLLGVGKRGKSEELCLVDIKEAIAPAAPRAAGARMPRDNAVRVVKGARQLAPHLGERMLASRLLGRSVFIRELLPQDLKVEIDQLTHEEAHSVSRYLAGVVGAAHGRQMAPAVRKQWRAVLKRGRSARLDAPSWLWSSVVALASTHEAAYLEHCRRYARSLGRA
jgi:uncharacterized protein (DUF2252 family)